MTILKPITEQDRYFARFTLNWLKMNASVHKQYGVKLIGFNKTEQRIINFYAKVK